MVVAQNRIIVIDSVTMVRYVSDMFRFCALPVDPGSRTDIPTPRLVPSPQA